MAMMMIDNDDYYDRWFLFNNASTPFLICRVFLVTYGPLFNSPILLACLFRLFGVSPGGLLFFRVCLFVCLFACLLVRDDEI